MIGWLYLLAGLVLSMIGNPLIKMSSGFEKPVVGAAGVLLLFGASILWAMSVKTLPLATAYVVWSGVGAFVIAIISLLYFHEPMSALKVLFMLMVVVGCVGLKVIEK